jgi:hypothetical protein
MRPLWDWVREFTIIFIVMLWYIPALQYKSPTIFIIATLTLIQHVVQILPPPLHADGILSRDMILLGALVLAGCGCYHQSNIILFTGLYSFLSKFKWAHIFARLFIDTPLLIPDLVNELVKVVVSLIVFVIVRYIVWRWHRRRRAQGRTVRRRVQTPFPIASRHQRAADEMELLQR